MKVLVTGGAGYIGSHTAVSLLDNGFEIVIADNLINSSEEVVNRIERITGKKVPFYKIDLRDKSALNELFDRENIESVIHFAGLKAVGESVSKPLEYYKNNIDCTLVLCEVMAAHNVKKFVFSSSATVYGDAKSPINEDAPLSASNPYGYTKLFIEQILRDIYHADNNWNIALLRYFNPIGAHPSGLMGEDPAGIPNNLMPYIARVAIGDLQNVNVFGNDYPTPDGTGVRDYIHVCDLAQGHIKAMEKLDTNPGLVTYNLGTGRGYSVLEVITAYRKASGKDIPYKIIDRRPGDVPVSYADTSKAEKELNFKAKLDIDDMCRDSWNWQSKNPKGYNS